MDPVFAFPSDRRVSAFGMDVPVVIPASCHHAILQHAFRELPNECCGVLIGRGKVIERAVPMRNSEPSPETYIMDPEEQIKLFREMEETGEQLIGIYHSHPNGPAQPSALDLQLAFHPDALYVVISLADPSNPDIRGFFLTESGFSEVPLNIV